jgi:hypothetical protein
MTTLDQALDVVMQLEDEQKDMLLEILQRRRVEDRRHEIAANAQEATRALRAGELRAEPADELIRRLHASLRTTSDEE